MAAVAALIALLYLTDWPRSELSQFWSEHALVSGTLTSVLLLGAGLLSADARSERRRQRLSEQVLRSVFNAVAEIADEIAATLRDGLPSEREALNGQAMADAGVGAIVELGGRLQADLATWLPVLGALPDGRGHEAVAASVRLYRTAGLTTPEADGWRAWFEAIGRLARSYELWLYAILPAVDESQRGFADFLPNVVPARPDLQAARQNNTRRLRSIERARAVRKPLWRVHSWLRRVGRWTRLQRLGVKREHEPIDIEPRYVCDLVDVVESAVAAARHEFPECRIGWNPPSQSAPLLLTAGFERGLAGALRNAAAAQVESYVGVDIQEHNVTVTVVGLAVAREVEHLFATTGQLHAALAEAMPAEEVFSVTLALAADDRLAGRTR